MKEFTSQKGGRHTYVDDIINLQDIALVLNNLFDGCDNFILSGCKVSGNKISAGFVYMNGKVRYCSGATSISTWPMYIVESNNTEQVSYADSADKVGRNIYGCVVVSSVPTTNDILTNKPPQSIKVNQDGTGLPTLKDAFFGKYSLMVDSPFDSQTVNKNVSFNGNVSAKNGVSVENGVNVVKGTAKCVVDYEADGTLVISSLLSGKSAYKIAITSSGDFQFYNGSTCLFTVSSSGISTSYAISSNIVKGGNIKMSGGNVYNSDVAADIGSIDINMLGYNGAADYFRNTRIGDGKNNTVFEIIGKTKAASLYGKMIVSSDDAVGLILTHKTLAKSDKTLQKYISWLDKSKAMMANVGFTNNTNTDFYVENTVGNVVINNDTYIQGSLYVNGTNLDNKYVKKSDYNNAIGNKADTSDVYSKDDVNSGFLKKTASISVFVDNAGGGDTGKKAVCTAIGAATTGDFAKTVLKSNKLTDVVNDGLDPSSQSYATELETRQRELCQNIGAAYSKDIDTKQKDTGWIKLNLQNCSISENMYVRQIGNIVSIQGKLHTHHSGTIFTLPSNVDPPKAEIGYSHNKSGNWHCIMEAGSRECKVDYCSNGCSEYVGFLLTYMV